MFQLKREKKNNKIPLGPKLLHYIMLLFRIDFTDYVIVFYITELVLNHLFDCVIFCVVTKHIMCVSDYTT